MKEELEQQQLTDIHVVLITKGGFLQLVSRARKFITAYRYVCEIKGDRSLVASP